MFSSIFSFLGTIKNYIIIGAIAFLMAIILFQGCELKKVKKEYETEHTTRITLEASLKIAELNSREQEANYNKMVIDKNKEIQNKYNALKIDNSTIESFKLSDKFLGDN